MGMSARGPLPLLICSGGVGLQGKYPIWYYTMSYYSLAVHVLILWVGPPLMVRPMSCLVDTRGHIPHTSYCPWSEVPITFSRVDQWADIPYAGRYPLILEATIKKVLFRKVLVNSGSALNLLFTGALKELGLGVGDLTPSDSSF